MFWRQLLEECPLRRQLLEKCLPRGKAGENSREAPSRIRRQWLDSGLATLADRAGGVFCCDFSLPDTESPARESPGGALLGGLQDEVAQICRSYGSVLPCLRFDERLYRPSVEGQLDLPDEVQVLRVGDILPLLAPHLGAADVDAVAEFLNYLTEYFEIFF